MAESNEPTYQEEGSEEDEQQLVYTADHTYDGDASGDHMVRVITPVGVFAEFVGTPGAELVILTPPGKESVAPDDEVRLQAHIKYQDSDMDPRQVTRRAEWRSSSEDVATVGTKTGESKGVLRGRSKGNTTVVATFGGLKASKKLRVADSTEARNLKVTPASGESTVEEGGELPLRSQVSDSDGQTHAVTGKTRFSSSDKEIATVSNDGTVKGVKAGTATITGKYKSEEGKTLATELEVTVKAKLNGEGDSAQESGQDEAQKPGQGQTPGQNKPGQDEGSKPSESMPQEPSEDEGADAEIPENNAPEQGGDQGSTDEQESDQDSGDSEGEAPATGGDSSSDSSEEPAEGGVEPTA